MNKKHLVIFGSGSDVAKAIIQKLDKSDWTITALSKSSDNDGQKYDARDPGSISNIIDSIDDQIDAVIFTQGTMLDQHYNDKLEEWVKDELVINYNSIVHATLALLPKFREQGGGQFIVMGSMAGLRGRASNFLYGSSKAGIMAFFDGLGSKYKSENISASIFVGGYINTKMTRHMNLPKLLTQSPQEVANRIIERGLHRRQRWIYPGFIWYLISRILKLSPRWVIDLLP